MNLRKQLSSYIALNNYVEAIRSSQLPAGYTELEYIESTGTQYIDTGVKASDCYGIYADFTPLGTHGLSGVFGSNTEAQNGTSLWLDNGSSVAFYIRPNTLVALSPQISTNNILNTRCVFSMLNRVATFTYNNVTSSGTYNLGTTTYDTTIKVCGCSTFYDRYSAKAKYNKFMLYEENNTLIRNFIPAKRNSDNVLGMYDLISNTFFTNQGTGSFTAGPEVYNSSIVLTDAITNGLTDLQLKGSEVKNKPEVFLDSVVAKGGTEQRNLPAEYTQVNYVTNTVITAVNTGVMIDFAKNYEFEVECIATTGSWYILQSREAIGSPITGISGSTNGNTISLVVGGISPCTSTIARTIGNKLYVKATLNNGVATLYVKDKTAGTEDTKTGSYDTSQTNPTVAMYLLGNAGGQYAGVNSDVYMARIKENGVAVMDYVPAKQGATAGFYDKASGTFKTALTPENLSAGPEAVPTPDTPIDIVSNNGVLKVSPNLFDKNASYALFTGYINNVSVGENTTLMTYGGGDKTIIIKVAPNTTYTVTRATNLGSVYDRIRCAAFTTLPTGGSAGVILCNYMNKTQANATFTTLSDTQYVAINVRNSGAVGDDWTQFVDAFQLEQGSTATQYRPYGQIYTDGTVETIKSYGKNLCDSNAFQSGYVNPNDGTILPNPQWLHTGYLYIGDAETYTYSLYTSVQGNAGRECAFYDKDKKFISGYARFVLTNYAGEASKTFTVPEGAKYIRISVANLSESRKDTNVQLEQGSTATEYEPYFDGGTATAEMLLKVGDYQDEQEILSGAVTRNIGIKVLDGTEDWTKGQSFYCNTLTGVLQADHSCYCTHYQSIMNNSPVVTDSNTCRVGYHIGSDIAWDRLYIYADRSLYATAQDFANYLAQQYAAGTPVIVVYPLNASTTETVSPQKLLKNPVTVTEASIDDLEVTTTEAEHTVPTPDYPLDIVCNNGVLKAGPNNSVIVEGTPETVTITGKNLFNESHIKSVAINDISVVIPVKQNKTYTWSYNKTEYDFRFASDFVWGIDLNGSKVENGVTLVYANGTYTTASYVTVTVVSPNVVALQTVFRNNTIQSTKENVLASSMQLEESIRPTKYEEYYQASFAPEDLLKLGDYQDVQDVINGIKSKKIGIKVLDGTENIYNSTAGYWGIASSYFPGIKMQSSDILATHWLKGDYLSQTGAYCSISGTSYFAFNKASLPNILNISDVKQWLADQYAAGTPVIVVYPLADTVEETVESKDVFITSGTNTIERSSEYVSSDGITVKYKKLR